MTAIVEVWSDVGCPFAHVVWQRLVRAREQLGIDVRFRHRSFPLELFNERATPRPLIDHEILIGKRIEPDAGWKQWSGPDHGYPVTTLLAMEAVHAATAQSLEAGEQLSLALRGAMFAESRCISLRHEIEAIARTCDAVNAGRLLGDLDTGSFRAELMKDYATAKSRDDIEGSPHVFLPGGENEQNPGIELRTQRDDEKPELVSDDPKAVERLLLGLLEPAR